MNYLEEFLSNFLDEFLKEFLDHSLKMEFCLAENSREVAVGVK